MDVALGAACCSLFFYFLAGLPFRYPTIVCLSLVVWLIYTLDHLADAKKIKGPAIAPRHRFHQVNFSVISISWSVVLCGTLFLIFNTLFPLTILFGVLTALLVVVHFAFVKWFGFRVSLLIQKELGIAVIYTIGVCIPALSQNFIGITNTIILVAFQVFLLAITNLLEFSSFEINQDRIEEQTSFARAIGERKIERITYALIVVNYLFALFTLIRDCHFTVFVTEGCILAMNSILLLILLKKNYFKKYERYRIWGDAVFLIPGILFLLEALG